METIISKDPSTGREIHQVPSTDPTKIPAIIEAARRAQETSWRDLSFQERSRYLERAKNYMLENIDAIAAAISLNNGKPLVEALAEVVPMIQTVKYLKNNAQKILRDQPIKMGWFLPTKKAYVTFQPMGVIGIISPWNYPLSTPFAEIAQALIAGNSVVLKPSEVTGLVNEWIQKIVDSMKLPAGVFTMIHGRGDVGATLAESSVDRIIITGSVATGRKVMMAAAKRLTPVTLELGGKDSMIILEDADIDAASSAAVVGSLYNAGQTCCSVERLLVHEKIAGVFKSALLEKIKKIRVGPSSDRFENDMGPITYEGQKKTYHAQLQDHLQNRGKTLHGETDFDGKMNFMKPLVVEGEDQRHFWKEETFGPVVAVKTFKTDDEAVTINNNTSYGLTALIWSKNNRRAQAVAKRLNVGTVVINDAPFTNAVATLPWGGIGESGFGRVHGEIGLKELCHARVVSYDIAGQQKQPWWYPYNKAQYDFLKNYAIFFEGPGFGTRLRALFQVIRNSLKMGKRL